MLPVPWPLATTTLCTPVPAVAPQLKTLLSSLPVRLTGTVVTGWVTVVYGLAGALITGTVLPQGPVAGVAELRGFGAPMLKSAALLSVSLQPPPLRMAAVVLDS